MWLHLLPSTPNALYRTEIFYIRDTQFAYMFPEENNFVVGTLQLKPLS